MVRNLKEVSLDTIEKQYTQTNVGDLAVKVSEVYQKYLGQLAQTFNTEVLDFNTCSSDALDYYWGQIFRINRRYKDENGNLMILTDEQFREVIKIRAFGTTWDGSIATMNVFLSNLFKDRGVCYMLDPQDMTYQLFVFEFELEDWERYLFTTYDIFPHPAGVSSNIEEVGDEKYFGFMKYDQRYPYPTTTGFTTYSDPQEGITITY